MSSQNPDYVKKVRQLQEWFPSYSAEDIQSVLNDVGGDQELAAGRIAEGKVEHWNAVSRKHDKRNPAPSHASKPSSSTRGDSRGARGGRGGRGGPGRGGALVRGRGGPPRGGAANGHVARPASAGPNGSAAPAQDASVSDATPTEAQNGAIVPSASGWTESSFQPETSTLATSVSGAASWGSSSPAVPEPALAPKPTPVAHVSAQQPQKLSWAQIAKPREKPAPPPPAPAPIPEPIPQPVAATAEPEPQQPEPVEQPAWEEPTTVEAPTWEDESKPVESQPALPEVVAPEPPSVPSPEPPTQVPEPPAPEPELAPEPPAQPKQVAPISPPSQPPVAATPSPKLAARPAAILHRSGPRYKIPDQPVTLPSSFGNSIEKVGMQFGSLNLNGEALEPPAPAAEPESPAAPAPAQPTPTSTTPAAEPVASSTPSTTTTSISQPPKPQQAESSPLPPAATSTNIASVFQQQQPSQPPAAVPQHTIPTSVSQPIQPTQLPPSLTTTTAPLQTFTQPQQQQQPSHQPSIHHQPAPTAQHIPHLPQQLQQSHHSYTQPIGLQSHLEQPQPASQQQAQPVQPATHANYFRQSETNASTPYFHTPTPPASQAQENPYGAFGPLSGQGQHQQGTPLGNFATSDYGYSDSPRGFYDSYAQPHGYRAPLEEPKGLASQQPTANSLPPSANQSAQQHPTAQGAQQNQSAASQGPQQNYPPPPVPYYFTHAYPQNQYYGAPYGSGYVTQPFVKYPPLFQPGPGGPGSAPTPTAKQPAGNVGVQPQANPYTQNLYQQNSYDDYTHPHHSQHSHNIGLNQGVGVGSAEYGKVYGGGAQAGSFMGLGSQSAGNAPGQASNNGPRTGTSPEAAYKPYCKDVGVGAGRGGPAGQQGGQAQAQGGQGPQSQGFYGGNRFGGSVGASGGVGGGIGGVGGPQQSGHHQQGGPQGHVGYAQGGNDPSFYSYQRQGQAYWQ